MHELGGQEVLPDLWLAGSPVLEPAEFQFPSGDPLDLLGGLHLPGSSQGCVEGGAGGASFGGGAAADASASLPPGWSFEPPCYTEQAVPVGIESLAYGGNNDEAPCSLSSLSLPSLAATAIGPVAASLPPPPLQHDAAAAVTEQEKLKQVRAQNRAKHARFRQRQKEKKQEQAQQYEAAAADLEREQGVNRTLRVTGALLEALRGQKDASVAVLQQAAEAAGGSGGRQGRPDGQLMQAPANGACTAARGGGASLAPGATLAQGLTRLPFEERVELCSRTFQSSKAAHKVLTQTTGAAVDWLAVDVRTKHAVSTHLVEASPQLLELALRMSADDVVKDWAECGAHVAGVLCQLDAGQLSEAEAEAQLRAVILYETILHVLLLVHRPEHEHHLLRQMRAPGESEEAAAARWHRVMLEAGVTREQVRAVVPAHEEYLARMQGLEREAARCLVTLQEAQQSLDSQLRQLGNASLSSVMQRYLGMYEAAKKLAQQPTAALLALEDFFFAMGGTMTPLQAARLMAACRPLHPDLPAIVKAGLQYHGLVPASASAAPAPTSGSWAWLPTQAAACAGG